MTNNDLLEPVRLYQSQLKDQHHDNVVKAFEELQNIAKVDEAANKATCKKLYKAKADAEKVNGQLSGLSVLKIFLILFIVGGAIAIISGIACATTGMSNSWIAIVVGAIFLALGIVLLATVYKNKKRELDKKVDELRALINKLTNEAEEQMAPLNCLFDSNMPAQLFHKTCPLIEMDRIFDVKKYAMMKEKFGLWDNADQNSSTLDIQSGSILGNPFAIFKDLNVAMVPHVYHGSKTITYTTGFGKERHTVTETLHATYTANEPIYSKETYLLYGNEGAQKLSFSREPSNINSMNEDQIKKYVRKHEKDLDKMATKQLKNGGSYTPIGNPEFELFFGGLDRDNEIEFRLLFTALGQKSMMDLLKSKVGYGDDFSFKKMKGLNLIQSAHSQGATLFADVAYFRGLDIEAVKNKFITFNDNYFKALFFDFAPLLSIPLYSQHKTHEYIYKDTIKSNFSPFMHEVMSNKFNVKEFAHKSTKTDVILKTVFSEKQGKTDIINVTAHSYDAVNRIAVVETYGGDGHFHSVEVPWIEYLPLKQTKTIEVADVEVSDEVKFNKLGNKDVIYAKGLISNVGGKLNVDIDKVKRFLGKI